MRVFVGILLGIIIAVVAVMLLSRDPNRSGVHQDDLSRAGEQLREGAREVADGVRDGVDRIDTDRIRENVEEGGRRIADASANAIITGKIKAQYAADSRVSALRIDVDTVDGVVTLSGKVSSQEEADRAVEVARGVKGVKDVISVLQIEP
jgi:hyperosmotically inducible periplasmic protein